MVNYLAYNALSAASARSNELFSRDISEAWAEDEGDISETFQSTGWETDTSSLCSCVTDALGQNIVARYQDRRGVE